MAPAYLVDSIKLRISCTRQAVVLGPSDTPFGYFPALIPFHHDAREIGNIDKTVGKRTNPVFGNSSAGLFGEYFFVFDSLILGIVTPLWLLTKPN
jgi:hypothetical protein